MGALVVAVGLLFVRLPTGFLPDEDQGVAFAQVQTPPGATQGRTQIVLDDVANYLLHQEASAVESALEVTGFNFAGRGQSQGLVLRAVQGLVRAKPAADLQSAGGAGSHSQASSARTRMPSSFRSIHPRFPPWDGIGLHSLSSPTLPEVQFVARILPEDDTPNAECSRCRL